MYRIKFVDEQTKEVLTMSASSDEAWAVKNGFSVNLYDVVTGYNGKQYIAGYAPTLPLDKAQDSQVKVINSAFTEAVASTKYNVPEDEVLTWDIQKLEAQAWELNNEIATPFIDGIAEARGIDRVELIEKVLLKVAAYKAHVSTQVGKRQGYEDAIYAATTLEGVYAVVWEED